MGGIDVVLAEAIGDNITLPTLYQLIEKYELVVYDKVIDGEEIPSDKLLDTLRQREQQGDDSFDGDSFQFWGTLKKEFRYSVYRKDVAKAYKNAGKLRFPWHNLDDEFVWLEYPFDCLNGMEEKLKLKQNLPKEPSTLNHSYKPETSFVQKNWDSIPDVNQRYWKHRDTLNIIELAFILKGKEPQPKATQYNITNLYPLDFCEFFAELLTLSDSSWKTGKLAEINPPAPYCEESAESPDFERDYLIEWALSKEINVPGWLMDKQSKKNAPQVTVEQFDLENKQVSSNEPQTELAKTEPIKDDGIGRFEFESTKRWKKAAWEIGEEWMKKQRNTGENPGVIAIAKYVEGELSNRNIKGAYSGSS